MWYSRTKKEKRNEKTYICSDIDYDIKEEDVLDEVDITNYIDEDGICTNENKFDTLVEQLIDEEKEKLPKTLVLTVDVLPGEDVDEILGDAISDATGFCVNGFSFYPISNSPKDDRYPEGAIYHLSGDSKDLWIKDYNVRVDSNAEIIKTPTLADKKVLVRIDSIDHDSNVFAYVRKSALKKRVRRGK